MERKEVIDEIAKLTQMAEWIWVPMITEIEEQFKTMSMEKDKEEIGELLPKFLYYKQQVLDIDNRIQLLRKDFFAFSYEELYSMFGRFDNFVSIDFQRNSEAEKDFGSTIMGLFIYNRKEREDLNKVISASSVSRTNKNVKFDPSENCNLTDEQRENLKRTGFLSGDIRVINHFIGDEKVDKYLVTEKKEIPNTIPIKIDMNDGFNWELMGYKLLSDRTKSNNPPLINSETDEYYAYKIMYSENEITAKEWVNCIYEPQTKNIRERIRFYILRSKMRRQLLFTPDEYKDLTEIFARRREERYNIVDKEIKKSASQKLKEVIASNQNLIDDIKREALFYETENLSTYGARHSVYLDLERYLHIFVRHFDEFQIGDWQTGKTAFQYNMKDVKRLLKLIIEKLQPQIDLAIEQDREISLFDKRAFYFNGNYYVIHIDKTGRLLSFYPHENL